MAEPVSHKGITYPSKKAATIALFQQGFEHDAIADEIGSTVGAVKYALRGVARTEVPVTAKPTDWTESKLEKAVLLFPIIADEVAQKLAVPVDELRDLWIKGRQPAFAVAAPEPEPSRDDDEAELAALDWQDDPEATFNILLLTDADVTPEMVDGWSADQRKEAEEWAGAVHLSASDNDDIVVPPRPDFVRLRDLNDRHPIPGQKLESAQIVKEVPTVPVTRFPDPPPAKTPVAAPRLIPPGGIYPGQHDVRLKRADGQWLHESLTGFTDKVKYAWQGDRTLFETVKARMPKLVAKLSMEVVA